MCQRVYRPGYSMPELSTPPRRRSTSAAIRVSSAGSNFSAVRVIVTPPAAVIVLVSTVWASRVRSGLPAVRPGKRRGETKSDRRFRAVALTTTAGAAYGRPHHWRSGDVLIEAHPSTVPGHRAQQFPGTVLPRHPCAASAWDAAVSSPRTGRRGRYPAGARRRATAAPESPSAPSRSASSGAATLRPDRNALTKGSPAGSPSRPPWRAGTTMTPDGSAQYGSVTASASGTTASQRIALPPSLCATRSVSSKYLAPYWLTELNSACAPPGPYGEMEPTR